MIWEVLLEEVEEGGGGECWFWRTITESVDLSKEVAAIIFIYGGCVCDFSRLFYFVLNKYSFWN